MISSEQQRQPRLGKTRLSQLLDFASRPRINGFFYVFVFMFFILLILLPTVYVLYEVVINFSIIQSEVLGNADLVQNEILPALFYSISVALIITIVDLIFGFPIAWTLVRRDFRFKSIINSFIELPLAVPTAGLGFSVALFWGNTVHPNKPFSIGIIEDALPILVLFHFTTTFPLVVRSLAAILEEIDITLEIAARTCGASKFTAARTVTLPLFRSGVATAMVLSLAKSLSDTGGVSTLLATMSLATKTGTVLIGDWKHDYQDIVDVGGVPDSYLIPAMAFLSAVMILIALSLVFMAKMLAKGTKLPFRRVFPSFEWRVSEGRAPQARQVISFGFLILFVIIPSFYLLAYIVQGSTGTLTSSDWTIFGQSILLSVIVATSATTLNVVLGVPMAILIIRKMGSSSFWSRFLDTLVDIPYVVPSSALGFSVGLFWGAQTLFPTNELFFVIMAHVSMTFPYIVRNTIGGLEELDLAYEDAARSLGARPFQSFRHVTFPVIRFSIIAGAIMSFTRSIGETGATLAVSPNSISAPVFIVDLIKRDVPEFFLAGLTTIILILISSALIFVLRALAARKMRR